MKQWLSNMGKTDIRHLLAIIWCIGALAIILVLIFHPLPKENKEVVYLAIGSLLSGTGVVLSFFFGSSKSETDTNKKYNS